MWSWWARIPNIDFTDMTLVIGDTYSDDARGGATVRRCKSKGFSYQQSDWLSSFSLLFSLRETPHFQHTTENVIKWNDSCKLRLSLVAFQLWGVLEQLAPEIFLNFFLQNRWSFYGPVDPKNSKNFKKVKKTPKMHWHHTTQMVMETLVTSG